MKHLAACIGLATAVAVVSSCSNSTGSAGTASTSGSASKTASGTGGSSSTGTAKSTTGQTSTMSTAASAAGGAASATGVDLAGTLGSSLGLTPDQASGAVGSILSLAQGKLSSSDYSKVAGAVPGAGQYVQKAKDLGAVPSTGISSESALDGAYAKLGISPEIGSQVTPLVVNYVGKAGGPTVQSLLSSVLQ
ncbi:MAG TPA: DUF2780 domain-containing protein [Thermoanaerobaculia bacterium]|nr:DUF2780 domain-containing protein [Thermoanaerobaculia bacterium]